MMKSSKIKQMVIVLLILVGVISNTVSAQEPCWNITQLTENIPVAWPQIWGDKVVWSGDDGNDWEIFLYNGTETIQLTNNDVDDQRPHIWGDHVVWTGDDGNDTEIFLYNGTETIQLTDNDVDDGSSGTGLGVDSGLRIWGDHVVWQGDDGNDEEIFLYNGTETIQLTDNELIDKGPQIWGDQVVWQGGPTNNDQAVFLFNATEIIQLTDYDGCCRDVQIWGDHVVWQGHDGDYEIFLYNGTETVQLTDNDVIDGSGLWDGLGVWGDNIVWSRWDIPADQEVLLYNGDGTPQLIGSSPRVYDLQIWGDHVVWTGWGNGFYGIYFFDGTETIQLSGSDSYEFSPSIWGSNVVWVKTRDLSFDLRDLFMASRCPIEVAVDIKPQLCPNPLNVKSKGVFDVAVLGSYDFDVRDIDVSTITLEGVAPIRSRCKDETGPVVAGQECECSPKKKDGFLDLTMKFDTEQIAAVLGEVSDGDRWTLTLTGTLQDGTEINGSDCIEIKKKCKRQ
jgi:hypothetical protein